MATLSHSDSRRLYSWWWDSHISPKNSKWLQENLTDMDSKVKAMIKLIEEDADSFARRAEMYYKKRPELMKLVEEFYRAYRALAERYDHATVELRQAHRTMAEAFPNQLPYELADDSSSGSSSSEAGPHTPEMPHPGRALFDPDDLHKDAIGLSSSNLHSSKRNGAYSEGPDSGMKKRGLKQVNEMFGTGQVIPHNSKQAEGQTRKGLNVDAEEKSLDDEFSQLSNENQKLKIQVHSESERASKAECDVQTLRKTLAEMQSEREAVLVQYQQSLEKLSNLETELHCAHKEARVFDERASKAETKKKTLKAALLKLEAERDASLLQYKQSSERITKLEVMISLAQEDAKGLGERASRAETEAQKFNQELSRLEIENEAGLLQYNQCLEKISALENKIVLTEEHARMLTERTDRAETEVNKLRQALNNSNEEKEAVALQYKQCLETIARLENEIFQAQEDAKQLNNEILMGATKLKSTEEQFAVLDRSNQSLRSEVDNLVEKMVMKDQELVDKNEELEKLQIGLQDERSRISQAEATLFTSQKLHTQSQEEQRALAMELRNGLQMLKDMEVSKHGLEEEIHRVKEENQCLNELNLSSTSSMQNMKNEITSLREMKEKLEDEAARQVDQSNLLEEEICSLKEEIKDLNQRYQALMEQVASVGLPLEFLGSSVKELQYENSKLKEICKKEQYEKEALSKNLENMEIHWEKNVTLENSLLDVSGELKRSKEKIKELQESFHVLQGEKSSLVAEKATLFSHLHTLTENIQKLWEKNASLESSLAAANVELAGLREKSKGLEEICQLLHNEKSNLLAERGSLVFQLKNVEGRLEKLENRFTELEEKYTSLEKEKTSTLRQVEELRVSLGVEKEEHANFTSSSESRLISLENHFCLLREESKLRKKEFEEEFDEGVNAQVEIFILQKFIQDLEEKNLSLLIECQKHVEASQLSDKLISELEGENLEQQMEAEFLLDEIEKLRKGIFRVLKALQIDPGTWFEDKIELEHACLPSVLESIEKMKCSASENEDERQRLLVENLVLATLLGQLISEGIEFESKKRTLDQELTIITENFALLQNEKHEILEMHTQLRLEVSKADQQGELLKAERESLHLELEDLQSGYLELQDKNVRVLEENRSLLKEYSDLKEKHCMVEDENDIVLHEAVTFSTLSLIFQSFGIEKAFELKTLDGNLESLHGVNSDLMKEVRVLGQKLELKETENRYLKESIEKMDTKLHEVRELNDQLNYQILIGKESLIKKENELSEAVQEVKATQNLNMQFCRTVDTLERKCKESELMRDYEGKQVLELSEENNNLAKEIECLHKVNGRLQSELGELHEEIEEHRIREKNLSSELQEKSNEFELWEAEAATFYFDLQFSSIQEVLLENKVHELTGVCESLEQESVSKSMEIELMKEKLSFLESETGGLKTQLSAYAPVIVSLKDDIASLEHNALFRTKINLTDTDESEGPEVDGEIHEKNCLQLAENKTTVIPHGISDLQKMQIKIKAVETAVVEEMERLAKEKSLKINIKQKAALKEIENLKTKRTSRKEQSIQKEIELSDETSDYLNLRKADPEISEARIGTRMKDIPLDQVSDCAVSVIIRRRNGGADEQMLELWQTAEQNCTSNARVKDLIKQESASMVDDMVYNQFVNMKRKSKNPSSELEVEKELGVDKLELSTSIRERTKEGYKRRILERLASDGQRLMSIQVLVQDLRKKTGTDKKSKKGKDQYGTAKEQLQEVEEAVVQLMDINGQLTKNIESPSFSESKTSAELKEAGNIQRKRVLEQARRGSEKIGRLQLEVQKIQYGLLKLEDEKKSQAKNRFSKSTTSIALRNFIHIGRRSTRRRKKPCFCGCLRPSTTESTEVTEVTI